MKYTIVDWCYNRCFGYVEFESFDDADEYLSDYLGAAYEVDREEYEIIELE